MADTKQAIKSDASSRETEVPAPAAPIARYNLNNTTNKDRNYLCGCQNCECGSAVNAPGDICDLCSRHSF